MAEISFSGGPSAPGAVHFDRVETWASGLVAHGRLEALRGLDHWTIVLAMEAEITSIWGARIVSRSGGLYTLADEGWNGTLRRSETAAFGFQAEGPRQEFGVIGVNGVAVGVAPDLPVVSLVDGSVTEGEGPGALGLRLSHAAPDDVTVLWEFAGGTAGAQDRAAAGPRSVVIPAGQTTAALPLRVIDDAEREGTERAWVRLTSASGAEIGRGLGALTIVDDDVPGLRLAPARAAEEDGLARMRVLLSEPAAGPVTVDWAVVPGGTATPATDLAGPLRGTLSFAPGQRQAVIGLTLRDDARPEPDETVHLRLSSARGAAIVGPEAVLTLTDADRPPPAPPLPEVALAVTTRWQGGFGGEITVTNDTGARLEAWRVTFEDPDFVIDTAWGAVARTEADGAQTLVGRDWAQALDAGESVTLGFVARGTAPARPYFDIHVPGASGPGPNPHPDPGPDTGRPPRDASPFEAEDYAQALSLSMKFYYAQYSGDLPGGFPLAWRGDSALSDGADAGRDLTGGWYDAGDHVKFGLPMASSATLLAWGAADFTEGYRAAGAWHDVLAHLEWVTDYFLRAYDDKGTARLSDDVFWAQVGDGGADHAYWGAPEDMTMARPAYAVTAQTPGTEVTAETAAALAASSIVFREAGRAAHADELLAAARKLFAFSEAYQGTYTDAVPAAAYYNSWSGYRDELAWSAAWLHEATGEAQYLARARDWYSPSGTDWALSWDDKSMGTAALLAGQTGAARYHEDLGRHIDHWMDGVSRTPGTGTNEGLAWLEQWGPNRYAANTAFLALQYAGITEARGGEAGRVAAVVDFAADQLDYMLGDNPGGQSYLVGFGEDYPRNPHHRGASGTTDIDDPAPNAHRLTGALVGGPDANGRYTDTRTDYIANEVATDYNAGFSGALAGLLVDLDLI
ncbi:glycoside hydrolase family 9 protein [Oceanicella sp. SM1341]|uniref:glycoside hydrolase family 9 protein n=1 Tax=Oceanicella sp. SM1341 TaxID=1548889 RepID=UPI0018E596EF|nr:glycoside hydrolase family 9 protein [Oceanicella sp. SM1341]